MSTNGRQYDIVVFGATGLTGKLTAQYIAQNLPTDIRWAIAGRSAKKLEDIAAICKGLNPDRIQPAVEVCNLDDAELGDLARKTTILITTVGPYAQYGEPAFKACAENGTNYLDVAGEAPFVARMIKKYEKAAQTSGAIMIPAAGLESAPVDLVTWSLVSLVRRELSAPTGEVTVSVHDLQATPSSGTLSSLFTMSNFFTVAEIQQAYAPYSLSPIPGPATKSSASLFSTLFGARTVRDLGTLTTSISGMADVPIVQRSWGLLGGPKFYGPRFHFTELMRARNLFIAVVIHLGIVLLKLLLALAPVRRLGDKYVPKPTIADMETNVQNQRVEYRATALPDVLAGETRKRAYCRAHYEGGMYHFTALLLAQAALTLLKDDVVAKKFGGGVLTPATLGQPFVDRLSEAGFKLELKVLDD